MIIFEPDQQYLDWLQELKKGDTVYQVNAHLLRPITPRDIFYGITLTKSTKKVVGFANLEFSRETGLELRDPRYCSWEGGVRIMPSEDWSIVEMILDDIESVHGYEATWGEVEFLVMLLCNQHPWEQILGTNSVREIVREMFWECRNVTGGYTGIGSLSLAESMKAIALKHLNK